MGLKVLAFIMMAIGAFTNYGAKFIVNRIGLAVRIKVKDVEEFSQEELKKYKLTVALARVKIVGLAILIVGVSILFSTYR